MTYLYWIGLCVGLIVALVWWAVWLLTKEKEITSPNAYNEGVVDGYRAAKKKYKKEE